MIVLVTDGQPSELSDDPANVTATAKQNGVQTFVIGIGQQLSQSGFWDQMRSWASPNSFYGLDDFNVAALAGPLLAQAEPYPFALALAAQPKLEP